ncbi:hypothetical protein QNI19_11665 [Cytophagaceae bacterium DM2B3-1]|uniref:Uncharacterized protein n=2 Tax=Xanthocytophaga flava TaxID=3048013 RepID=A0ABT7CIM6_9BACT|nr:hypothetical protein [Xanthocytophaga flavus]
MFSPKLWKQDTLGKYGYKYHIVAYTQIIYDLYGKTIEEVERYLGLPDYFCMKEPCEECMAYVYHYEFYSRNLPPGYVYIPKQDCKKYIDTGSTFVVVFSTETYIVTSVQRLIKN